MRDCPTVEGPSVPLIIHRVTASSCATRQSCNYHKCHRCIYRGQAEDWEPDELPQVMLQRTTTLQREATEKQVVLARAPVVEHRGVNGSAKRSRKLESSRS